MLPSLSIITVSKKTAFASTAVALMMMTSVGHAADLGYPAKAPVIAVAPYTWTGIYVGGEIGYGWGNDHLMEYFTATNVFTGFQQKYTHSGIFGGVFGGGNYQFGNFVLGLEGDFDETGIKGAWADGVLGKGDTKIDWMASARGRVGYAFDRAMIYGTGGAAFASINHTYVNLATGVSETASSTRAGWTAGAGVEYAFTPSILGRVEYRYSDFGTSSYSSVTSFPGLSGTQEPTLSTVRAGIAYKF